MKQINIEQPLEFSANVSTKSAFAVVDTNPQNESGGGGGGGGGGGSGGCSIM
jgi:mevalonate kinase